MCPGIVLCLLHYVPLRGCFGLGGNRHLPRGYISEWLRMLRTLCEIVHCQVASVLFLMMVYCS
jgi:hypothetical protein